jgi:hypothetical protein
MEVVAWALGYTDREKLASHEQSPKHDQSISKWQSDTNFMLGQPF